MSSLIACRGLTDSEAAKIAAALSGAGAVNRISKYTGSSTLGNSGFTDDGTSISTAENIQTTGHMAVGASATVDTLIVLNIKETFTPVESSVITPALSFDATAAGSVAFSQPVGLNAKVSYIGTGPSPLLATIVGTLTQNSAVAMNTIVSGVLTPGVFVAHLESLAGSASMGEISLIQASYGVFDGGVPSKISGFEAQNLFNGAVAGVTTANGMWVRNQGKAGVTNANGIQIDLQTGSTNNDSIWLTGNAIGSDIAFGSARNVKLYYDGTNYVLNSRVSGTANFSFQGGTILPRTGTATAGTSPVKFTSGALLTAAEAGSVEFLTDKFYATITTGAARKTLAFLESPIFTTPATIGYTVATLPAGVQGMRAYVTDALAPAFLVALVGGGAVVTPSFYNGAAWIAY